MKWYLHENVSQTCPGVKPVVVETVLRFLTQEQTSLLMKWDEPELLQPMLN